jgi:hypothetical protein
MLPAQLSGTEQINPRRGIEERPVCIPGEPKNVLIGHTLKFSESSLLHTTDRCHVITEHENQCAPHALLAIVIQYLLEERWIEILSTILCKGEGIVQIHLITARGYDAANLSDVDWLAGRPAIGKDFVSMLGSPELFSTGKARRK